MWPNKIIGDEAGATTACAPEILKEEDKQKGEGHPWPHIESIFSYVGSLYNALLFMSAKKKHLMTIYLLNIY